MTKKKQNNEIGECEVCGGEMTTCGWYCLCTDHSEKLKKGDYTEFKELFKEKGFHPYESGGSSW